jgi:hypothetical protein
MAAQAKLAKTSLLREYGTVHSKAGFGENFGKISDIDVAGPLG